MIYYLLLGGNEGDVDATMACAVERIAECGAVAAVSGVYESEAWGFESALPFHNQAVKVVSDINPFSMLSFLKHLEVTLGRKKKTAPDGAYSDRPIDIDILFAGSEIVNTEVLQIPHPRLPVRRFALVPLAEIAPALVHPLLHKNITELLKECPDSSIVTEIK